MKKMLLNTVLILLVLLTVIGSLLYFLQEKLIFFPEKLASTHRFSFYQPFEEININTDNGAILNAVLFKSRESKGVIFYLHGNAGSLNSWGEVAGVYTNINYDVFMMDYRGYGKSTGTISSEKQLFGDAQAAYDTLTKRYDERSIVILGYSIGTGMAAHLAATNHPKLLILQAPFYNFKDLVKNIYPFVPTVLLRYRFETNNYITNCKAPIVIFHGDRDEVIYYGSSVKLKRLLKANDRFITLKGEGHNGMSSNLEYLTEVQKILK